MVSWRPGKGWGGTENVTSTFHDTVVVTRVVTDGTIHTHITHHTLHLAFERPVQVQNQRRPSIILVVLLPDKTVRGDLGMRVRRVRQTLQKRLREGMHIIPGKFRPVLCLWPILMIDCAHDGIDR